LGEYGNRNLFQNGRRRNNGEDLDVTKVMQNVKEKSVEDTIMREDLGIIKGMLNGKGKSVENLMRKEKEIKAKKGNLLFLDLKDSDSVDLGDHRETTHAVKRAVNVGVQQNSHVAEETPLRGVSVCQLSNTLHGANQDDLTGQLGRIFSGPTNTTVGSSLHKWKKHARNFPAREII
jgi:hypothetical protein